MTDEIFQLMAFENCLSELEGKPSTTNVQVEVVEVVLFLTKNIFSKLCIGRYVLGMKH